MATFVGWIPTALGRLSFTSIGDRYQDRSYVLNHAKQEQTGRIFGVKRRRDRGWVPGIISRLWGHHPSTDYAFFFKLGEGTLPFGCETSSKPSDALNLRLERTPDGALIGEVFALHRWGWIRGRRAIAALDYLRDWTVEASSKDADSAKVETAYSEAMDRVRLAWRQLASEQRRGRDTPDFGRADIVVMRTGECRITVDPEEHSLWLLLRDMGVLDEFSPDVRETLQTSILEEFARGIFLALRDLAHKHYHRQQQEAITAAVTPWTADTDKNWRKRTLEGLMRMCVAHRRRGTAASLRQALGVLAYADAFQKHLGTWWISRGQPARCKPYMVYDFSALKASIEASLKSRELQDQNWRARMFFAFGTFVTALTIILPTYRERWSETQDRAAGTIPTDLPASQQMMLELLRLAVDHPGTTLFLAALLGFVIDYLIVNMSQERHNYSWRAWSSRKLNWLLTKLRLFRAGSRTAQYAVIVLLLLMVAGTALIWMQVFAEVKDSFVYHITHRGAPDG